MTNLEMYIEHKRAKKASEGTLQQYERHISSMLNQVGKKDIDITDVDLMDWQDTLSKYAPKTINAKISAITDYFNYLMKRKVISENPTSILERVTDKNLKEVVYIPMEEALKLLIDSNNKSTIRNNAIISVYLTLGLRASELVNLTLEDYEKGVTTIKTKGDKPRIIKFNDSCRKYIDKYLEIRLPTKQYNNLFISNQGTPMNPKVINKTLKNISKQVGLNENIHNHSLRHTCISNVYDNFDLNTAKEFIGHSDISTTGHYVHSRENKNMEIIDSITL